MGDYFLQQLVNALSAGSLYALMAVGLAMVFGILRLINFAHGDLMMIAAYIAVLLLGAGPAAARARSRSWSAGRSSSRLLMERVAYRPIRGAPDVAMLLTSFAVGQILQNGTLLTTRLADKPQQIAFPSPEGLGGVATIGSITVPQVNIISFVAGTVLLALLTVFVTRTRLGLSMRAAAEDLVAAQLMGIKVNRVVATAFAIGGALAAVAGLLFAVQAGQINPYIGLHAGPQGVHRRGDRRLREHRRRGGRRLRARLPRGPGDGPDRDRRPAAAGLRAGSGPRVPPDRGCRARWRAIATPSCSSPSSSSCSSGRRASSGAATRGAL